MPPPHHKAKLNTGGAAPPPRPDAGVAFVDEEAKAVWRLAKWCEEEVLRHEEEVRGLRSMLEKYTRRSAATCL